MFFRQTGVASPPNQPHLQLQQYCSIEVGMARFTIDTDQQFDQNLNDLVKMTGGTKADVIRKALATTST
jgi:hypothetical protein